MKIFYLVLINLLILITNKSVIAKATLYRKAEVLNLLDTKEIKTVKPKRYEAKLFENPYYIIEKVPNEFFLSIQQNDIIDRSRIVSQEDKEKAIERLCSLGVNKGSVALIDNKLIQSAFYVFLNNKIALGEITQEEKSQILSYFGLQVTKKYLHDLSLLLKEGDILNYLRKTEKIKKDRAFKQIL